MILNVWRVAVDWRGKNGQLFGGRRDEKTQSKQHTQPKSIRVRVIISERQEAVVMVTELSCCKLTFIHQEKKKLRAHACTGTEIEVRFLFIYFFKIYF